MASSDPTPGTPPGPRRSPSRAVDSVAFVLAVSLGLLANLILIGTIAQIVKGNPEIVLSVNATQILITGTSGLTGLLGAYIGYRLKDH